MDSKQRCVIQWGFYNSTLKKCESCQNDLGEECVKINLFESGRFTGESCHCCLVCFEILKLAIPKIIPNQIPGSNWGSLNCENDTLEIIRKFKGKKE